MAKTRGRSTRWKRLLGRLHTTYRCLWTRLRGIGRLIHPRPVPIEVIIIDRTRRRTLERDLRAGLRRIERHLGGLPFARTTVLVQQVLGSDPPLAGCTQIGRQPDGQDVALIRLALHVNGRRLGTDEILAVLADQCVALAFQRCGHPSVLIPFDLSADRPTGPTERRPAPRPDPLVPAQSRPLDRGA